MKKIVFSGIQPSAIPTIGNYIGAIRQWQKIQKKYFCIYCIVDLHAITKEINAKNLKKNIFNILALYLACGINPKENIIFVQSHVKEHTELFWILNKFSYYGELNRMTQFKNQYANFQNKKINAGIFNYPILMAADILLYKTDLVPVGKDQKQHLELTKKIAKRFNLTYGNIFKTPKILLPKLGNCIMSLLNPEKKMSKSDKNINNFISLLEDEILIEKKIKQAVTDLDNPPIIKYDVKNKAGISNLLTILSILSEKNIEELEKEFIGKKYIDLKNIVSKCIITFINNLKKNYSIFRNDEKYLKKIIFEGAKKARKHAKNTLQEIYKAIGIGSV